MNDVPNTGWDHEAAENARKRFELAKAALTGLLSGNCQGNGRPTAEHYLMYAHDAVAYGDATLLTLQLPIPVLLEAEFETKYGATGIEGPEESLKEAV